MRGLDLRAALGVFVLAGAALGAPLAARAQGPDFADLVERVGPSVVNIRTSGRRAPAAPAAGDKDKELQDFFRRFGVDQKREANLTPQRGGGSGFFVHADGHVLTTAHLVEGAEDITVTLTDKREFKARIVGADKRSDVALLKIDAGGLPALRPGDVARLRVGEWVIAIGSPFGMENTVTAGIVSAKARETGEFVAFIQTDVSINPGNAGGPLINMRGEVVGINSQIYTRSGNFMGISFSIPIDEAMRVADQLRSHGRVIRGRIGVQIDEVTREMIESLNLPRSAGALVRSVEPGGPAEKAGLEAGDIVVRFDARNVERSSELSRWVNNMKPGTRVTLQVLRRGVARELHLVVAEAEAEPARRDAATNERDAAAQTTTSTPGLGRGDVVGVPPVQPVVPERKRIESVSTKGGR